MYPDLFTIGPFTLHSFGLMAMLGFLIPTLFMRREFARINLDPDFANTIAVSAIIGGFIGARIYYIIEHWSAFLSDPVSMIFSGAGLVWYGGLFGGFLAVSWAVYHYKMPYWRIADTVGMLLLLGQAFGRMGCFLAADGDYGPPTDVPWAMSFPNGVVPTDQMVHPTPLYDIALLLLFFSIIWPLRKKNFTPGTYFGLYLIAVGVERFITEFWRTTPIVLFDWMTMAQIISVVLFASGLTLIIIRNRIAAQEPAAASA